MDTRSLSDLLDALRHVDWKVRERAADALGSRSEDDVTPALVAALADANTAVVDAAAESIVRREDPTAVPGLLRAMHLDEGEGDQVWSVLNRHRPRWLREPCLEALWHDDPLIRQSAVELFGTVLREPAAIPRLRVLAADDQSEEVRASAEQALSAYS